MSSVSRGRNLVVRLALVGFVALSSSAARAEDPPSTATATPASGREAQLEERVRQLEAIVKSLSNQVQQMSPQPAPPGGESGPMVTAPSGAAVAENPDEVDVGGPAPRGSAAPDVGSPATAVAPSASGGVAGPGQSLPPNPPPSSRFNQPATLDSLRANAKFGPGFEIRSNDDEYIFQFHDLTQLDYRGYYPNSGDGSVPKDGFGFPRQWFMFSGRVSRPWGYFVSLAHGFDTINLLDCFIDAEYDPRIRLRMGRFKTPFTYEFFVEPVQGLTVPERSIFFNNFALNRSAGIMAFGRILRNKVDYGVGVFNSSRNSEFDLNNGKSVAAFVNYRPFGDEENTVLENFNIGGSVYAGAQHQVPLPQMFRTVVPTSGNPAIGTEFLGLNSDVRADGPLAYWDLHMAWYYRQLAVIGEWGSGFQDYSRNSTAITPTRTNLPVQSFYVQTSYLLTGETRSSQGIVKPNSPFDIRKGKLGVGAWEPYFRYEYLDISDKVFTQGLADPNQWANRVQATHVGINWHLTQYVKMYFDWNYDWFNQSVIYGPNHRMKSADLFLWRLQLYF